MTHRLPLRLRGARVALWAALAVSVFTGAVTRQAPIQPAATPASRLTQALAIADSFASGTTSPGPATLAADMHTADPTTVYQPLRGPYQVPQTGAIGVFAAPQSIWLRLAGEQHSVELRQEASAGAVYGPSFVPAGVVADGTFNSPLSPAWSVASGGAASVARDPQVHLLAPASLRVTGRGTGTGGLPTTVTQMLPGRPRGSEYLVGLVVRTSHLSRPISVELKLNYVNGDYQFFLATAWWHGTVVDGIPPGSVAAWTPMTIRAVAARRVRSAELFLVDTGSDPVRGTAWIDDVTLQTS